MKDEKLTAHSGEGLDSIGDSARSPWPGTALLAQFHAVRREIELRIVIQSTIVVLAACSALAAMVAGIFWPEQGMRIAVCFALFDVCLTLHWMHNGVRHRQLGTFLATEVEPRLESSAKGWESFYRGLGPMTPLGSFWFVGTKGILAAAPTMVAAVATLHWHHPAVGVQPLFCVGCSCGILVLTRLPRVKPPLAVAGRP